MKKNTNRRKFLKTIGNTSLLVGGAPLLGMASSEESHKILRGSKKISANDKIRIAAIGTGIMGHENMNSALKVDGVELAAACDLYTGRLTRIKEKYGKKVDTTRDYREILDRKDIDAVLVSTSDQWHARIAMDAMKSGKHVYCEKPLVQQIKEGQPLLDVYKESDSVVQVGSQLASSLAIAKARELYEQGAIGNLNCIEATYDRQSALGAWQYTLPTDASPETVDWDAFMAGSEKTEFDPLHFFRWRNYREYGTGVAGDLFVHLLTTVHMILKSNGPRSIYSSGQLAYWRDGRNVPDVMAAIMEYPEAETHPEFQLTLRVNFASGKGPEGYVRFIGDEGVMEVAGNTLKISNSIMSEAPGIGGWDSLATYPESMQEKLKTDYDKKYTDAQKSRPQKEPTSFSVDQDTHRDHFADFFEGVRTGSSVIEGPEFGFRACAPCLLCNDSYFNNEIMNWDPVKMKQL